MKILYCGISSKYIHTMPAGWFLSEYLSNKGIEIEQLYMNVNQSYDELLSSILSKKPNTLLFSVYIFNVIVVTKLISDIRARLKDCQIIIGGPEVDEDMEADYIIIGEGEEALYQLLKSGSKEKIIHQQSISNLDNIPSPYHQEHLKQARNKLLYYESSRGCPFKCSYCMASLSNGVRYFSIDRVKADLLAIVENGVKVIKFTDRTFNANTSRTNELLNFILEEFYDSDTCFHLEVGGDLFQRSTLNILAKMPKGRIQMEAGVQTLNTLSLKAINRVFQQETFMANIREIISFGNIHMHLDLIAGLPCDSLQTFIDSFNQVMSLRPNVLQLGFLKFLKGTPLRSTYQAEYSPIAPYEIISSPTMKKEELMLLKEVEFVFDKLYNSGKFPYTIQYLLERATSPFALFHSLSEVFKANELRKGVSESAIFECLINHYSKDIVFIKDLLKFDYLITNNSKRLYPCIKTMHKGICKKFLAQHKRTEFTMYECFAHNPFTKEQGLCIIKFDYSYRCPVSLQYSYKIVQP